MKVYFPTSTLNFSSIISSQRILPAQHYSEGALWWNRYEKTAAERDAVTVLYNRFPVWKINDPDRDNYPLVIAFDACPVAKKTRVDLNCEADGKKLTAIFTNVPVEVPAKDILSGKIEFIFRSESEKRRILLKAESGADECKILSMLMSAAPNAFSVAGQVKNAWQLPVDASEVPRFDAAELKALENKYIAEGMIREERLRGAELGFTLGLYIRSLRSGAFCFAFRDKIEFGDWRDEILPKPFNSVLEKFIDRPAMSWDPNRSAVLKLVEEVMSDFAKDKSVDRSIKDTFPVLRNHWGSAEQRFKISEIGDAYLQAFAAFLECGTIAGKYPRYLKSEKLKSPEFMLALYGAVVGYTFFSRTLMINESYLPPPPPPPPAADCPVMKTTTGSEVQSGPMVVSETRAPDMPSSRVESSSKTAPSFAQKIAEERKAEAKAKKRLVQGSFLDEMSSSPGLGTLADEGWIVPCAEVIEDAEARQTFIDDMRWFVGNHKPNYTDKNGTLQEGHYYLRGSDLSLDSIRQHMESNVRNEKVKSFRPAYQRIPVDKIMGFLKLHYGN